MADASMSSDELSADELLAVDEVCDRFEAAWREPDPPQIDAFLCFEGQLRGRLLAELIQIDRACREKRGTKVEIQVYVEQFAEHAEDIRRIPSQDVISVRSWRIEVVRGPHKGLAKVLACPGRVVIGRSSSVGLSLPDDPRCSREHAALEYSSTSCSVTDADSKNGVYVNGVKISSTSLQPGDLVTVGETRFRIDAVEG